MHIYAAVNCKTPDCRNVCALKYFGVDVGQVEIQEMTPTGVTYQCGNCGIVYRYEREEMYMFRSPHAPPPGWINGWEP